MMYLFFCVCFILSIIFEQSSIQCELTAFVDSRMDTTLLEKEDWHNLLIRSAFLKYFQASSTLPDRQRLIYYAALCRRIDSHAVLKIQSSVNNKSDAFGN